MENLKIKVENEAESKEALNLLRVDLKYGNKCFICNDKTVLTHYFDDNKDYKEIILPQLRDLVVLKRNSIDDATHFNAMLSYYKACDGWYYFDVDVKLWLLSVGGKQNYYDKLKPITKEEDQMDRMKEVGEWLDPDDNYSYHKCAVIAQGSGWIEVPEGAVKAYLNNSNTINFVNIDDDYMNSQTNGRWINTHRGQHEACGHVLVWQRKETLNDKAASAETARQADKVLKEILEGGFEGSDAFIESNVEQGLKHPHYKKDVSHFDVIDIYRVTELFSPHACGAHIAKKALCSGQRGHKDLLTDIQDIIDTAERWKEMLIEDANSCKD